MIEPKLWQAYQEWLKGWNSTEVRLEYRSTQQGTQRPRIESVTTYAAEGRMKWFGYSRNKPEVAQYKVPVDYRTTSNGDGDRQWFWPVQHEGRELWVYVTFIRDEYPDYSLYGKNLKDKPGPTEWKFGRVRRKNAKRNEYPAVELEFNYDSSREFYAKAGVLAREAHELVMQELAQKLKRWEEVAGGKVDFFTIDVKVYDREWEEGEEPEVLAEDSTGGVEGDDRAYMVSNIECVVTNAMAQVSTIFSF